MVSVFDRGLNYGDGLFETMKAHRGRVLLFREHTERLLSGARTLGIPTHHLYELEDMVHRLLRANGLEDTEAYVKVILTRGVDHGGHLPSSCTEPTTIIMTKPLDTIGLKRMQKDGVKAVTVNAPGCCVTVGGIKSLNYLVNVLGRIEASSRGAHEAIFIAPDNSVLEGTSSNVFIVKNGIIKTPSECDVLPGVTRRAVVDLALKIGIPVKEMRIGIRMLRNCDEAFLTNSIMDIVPLTNLDSSDIGKGRPGRVTRLLQAEYARLCKR